MTKDRKAGETWGCTIGNTKYKVWLQRIRHYNDGSRGEEWWCEVTEYSPDGSHHRLYDDWLPSEKLARLEARNWMGKYKRNLQQVKYECHYCAWIGNKPAYNNLGEARCPNCDSDQPLGEF